MLLSEKKMGQRKWALGDIGEQLLADGNQHHLTYEGEKENQIEMYALELHERDQKHIRV